jgi:hypothetical protein
VQNLISADLIAVPVVGNADVFNVYVTPAASAADVDSKTDRPIIGEAFAVTIFMKGNTLTAIANMTALSIANFE